MSKNNRQIDFIPSNFQKLKKIERPSSTSINKNKKIESSLNNQNSKKKEGSKSFTIQKSFVPQNKPYVNEAIAPELRRLKDFYKTKILHERKLKQLVAQGKIQKEDIEGVKKPIDNQKSVDRVKVDETGQIRDQKGNLLFVKNRTAELSINKRIQQDVKLREMNKKQKIKYHENLSKKLKDLNLVVVSGNKRRIKRSRLGLQFMEKGSYQSVSALKDEVKRQVLNLSDVFHQSKQQEVQTRIVKKRSRINLQFNREVPQIQWWDKDILSVESYADIFKECNINPQEEQNIDKKVFQSIDICNFINIDSINDEVRFQKVGNDDLKDQNVIMPMFLTKTERKKLKRKKKKEKLLQKNDKIKLGLIQPEKPKLRVANMAVVMKNQFIMDPSKIQQIAKRQQAERLNKHLDANSSRKLTKKQRQEKHIRKLKRDSAKECKRVVFKLGKLSNTSHIFKVNMNAKQLALNGMVIKPSDYHRQVVMVAAEGGSKAIKFFKNLMLNRIKWEQDDNKCVLVWEGIVDNTTLGKWTVHEVGDESETIKILKQKNVQFFWDYIVN